jgi:hypothetical protein
MELSVHHGGLCRQTLLERLENDDDRIAVWRDVLATTNGAKIKAADVDNAISRFLAPANEIAVHCMVADVAHLNAGVVIGTKGTFGVPLSCLA